MPVLSIEAPVEIPGLALSQQQVQALLEGDSPAALVAATQAIAGAYGSRRLKPTERKAAEQIFRLLVRETEQQVRATLAEHVKDSADIPRDIVLTLAHDATDIALPVLQYSEVLNDADLLELIGASADIERYLAIARRAHLSQPVTGQLLDKKIQQLDAALADNEGADISEERLLQLVNEHQDNPAMMQALSNRPFLPLAVAEKLTHVVAGGIGEVLKQKYSLGKDMDIEIDKARESETLKLLRFDSSPQEIDRLISQLIAYNRLSPALILSSLCQGNFQFFETALARLSGIPVANARTLIRDRGDLGFRGIYNKSGLPESLFHAVRLLLKVVHALDEEGEKPSQSRYAARVIERILAQSETGQPVENLAYIVALVRRAVQP